MEGSSTKKLSIDCFTFNHFLVQRDVEHYFCRVKNFEETIYIHVICFFSVYFALVIYYILLKEAESCPYPKRARLPESVTGKEKTTHLVHAVVSFSNKRCP